MLTFNNTVWTNSFFLDSRTIHYQRFASWSRHCISTGQNTWSLATSYVLLWNAHSRHLSWKIFSVLFVSLLSLPWTYQLSRRPWLQIIALTSSFVFQRHDPSFVLMWSIVTIAPHSWSFVKHTYSDWLFVVRHWVWCLKPSHLVPCHL